MGGPEFDSWSAPNLPALYSPVAGGLTTGPVTVL